MVSTLHITTKLINTPTKQPYHIDILNDPYKITTESIKLILDVEQFGVSSNLIIPTHDVHKVSFSSFFILLQILIKTFHGFHQNAIGYFSAQNSPRSLKPASIILCCLLYLQHKFQLKMASFVAAEILTCQMQLTVVFPIYFME